MKKEIQISKNEHRVILPDFNTVTEKLVFLRENKNTIFAAKKSITKRADGFGFVGLPTKNLNSVAKTINKSAVNGTEDLRVKAVINTTMIMDSHDDVHINGIWNKTVKENKLMMHVREHQSNKFDFIISDGSDLKASVEEYEWKDLGFNFEGKTEALLFDSIVKASRNPYMHEQYNKGYVKNHSVGMRYINIALAIGNKDHASVEEYELFQKYINNIANKEYVEERQYFFAVFEAKAIEGSAVPLGSNAFTPTVSVEAAQKALQDAAVAKTLQDKKQLFL